MSILRSQEPKNAVFQSFSVLNSSRLRIDGIRVSSPTNGSAASRVVAIENGSHHIEFINSEVNGLVDSNYLGHYGIFTLDCHDVTIRNNYVHDVHDGILGFGSSNLLISDNIIDFVGRNSFKFGGIDQFTIENNTGAGHVYPQPGDHIDFLQFQGSSSNGLISGNVLLPITRGAATAQGIFLADGDYVNITIEQNIIYTGMVCGIQIEGSNNTVRNNTLLNAPNLVHGATTILDISNNLTNSKNIVSATEFAGRISANGIACQHYSAARPAYYDTLFKNARRGLCVTLEDLRPVPGSAADFGSGMGAERRLYQLLNP